MRSLRTAVTTKGVTPCRSTGARKKASRPYLRSAACWRVWRPFRASVARRRVSQPFHSIAALTKASQSFRASVPMKAQPFARRFPPGGSEPSGHHRCCRSPVAEPAPSGPENRPGLLPRRDERALPCASPRTRSFAAPFPFEEPSGVPANRRRSEADSARDDRRQAPEMREPRGVPARSLCFPKASSHWARARSAATGACRPHQASRDESCPASALWRESSSRASDRSPSSGCRRSAPESMRHQHPAG